MKLKLTPLARNIEHFSLALYGYDNQKQPLNPVIRLHHPNQEVEWFEKKGEVYSRIGDPMKIIALNNTYEDMQPKARVK